MAFKRTLADDGMCIFFCKSLGFQSYCYCTNWGVHVDYRGCSEDTCLIPDLKIIEHVNFV